MSDKQQQEMFPRFRLMARIEHIVLLLSFTVLGITGLPQMYAQYAFPQSVISALGGIETVRIIHRYSAFILVLGSFYHLLTSAFRLYVKGERMRIMLRPKDAVDIVDTVRYNLGLKDERPKMTKFNFGEKIEYWAVIWGTAVMVVTGFMLWNPIAVTNFLPGEVIPAAKTAHGMEAVLAVLSILIWHLYNVLIKHRNFSIFTGKIDRHEMEIEHAIELERLDAGGDPYPGLNLPAQEMRKKIFFAVSIAASIVVVLVLVYLFTFEETAVITILPTREVFVPMATAVP